MIIQVPVDPLDQKWPTLGPQVCDWMETNLVFGPGDLLGKPLVLDDERRYLIYRFYELYPKGRKLAGRRRFQRCGLSLAKGRAKTELAALIAAAELHPEAPVRFDGWTKGKNPQPIGAGVKDPYIPMLATTEQQSDELAYGALKAIIENSPVAGDFDCGEERILRIQGNGIALSLSSAPSARDGARTTFAVMDETHLWTSARLRKAYETVANALPKRKLANPWMLEVTTAPEPGAGSVAEGAMDFALAVHAGELSDVAFFFYHMQASDEHDLTTAEGVYAAAVEASGEASAWRDIDAIVNRWKDPTTDRNQFYRVWLNMLIKSGSQAFDVIAWKALKSEHKPEPGAQITIGFDGSQLQDGTALVCTEIESGFQWVAGVWECPPGKNLPGREPDWRVPVADVDAKVRELFDTYDVWRMYADPPFWQEWIAKWQGDFVDEKGDPKVLEWWTNRRNQMAAALENFDTAIRTGTIAHDGDTRYQKHLGHSRRINLGRDKETERVIWLIAKDRKHSPNKIDIAMAGCLSFEARTDAIAAGVLNQERAWNGEIIDLGDYLREGPLPNYR